jgi:5-formyltetrahydrofolate cyclo-ligase
MVLERRDDKIAIVIVVVDHQHAVGREARRAAGSSMGNVSTASHSGLPCYLRCPLQQARDTMTDVRAQIEAKVRARNAAKHARAAAFARHGSTAAERIAERGLGFSGFGPHAIVSGFCAIGDELDPLPLLAGLSAAGHKVCLPVMQGKGVRLLFREWKHGDPMKAITWGIREPLPSAPPLEPDVLLVPLLAFDPRGYRLGYGGGFYDRTLADLRAHKAVIAIGVGFDEQRVESVPHVEYDQRLDWVLTPSGPLRTS